MLALPRLLFSSVSTKEETLRCFTRSAINSKLLYELCHYFFTLEAWKYSLVLESFKIEENGNSTCAFSIEPPDLVTANH